MTNVNYTDKDRQEEVILRSGLNVVGIAGRLPNKTPSMPLWMRVRQNTCIILSLNRVLVQPGTQLALDLYIKAFHFNIHDEIAVTEQPVAQGTISGAGNYGEFCQHRGRQRGLGPAQG